MAQPAPVIVDEATDEILRVHLDVFQGPFEVLLYLIKVQEIDIFDIPIVKITDQFVAVLELMHDEDLEGIGDFVVLAATLIQIKSKMLLPVESDSEDDDEFDEDPRLELVEKLLEYRQFKDVTERMRFLEEARNAWFSRDSKPAIEEDDEDELLEVTLFDLTQAFRGVLRYFAPDNPHVIDTEAYSVDDKIDYIKECLAQDGSVSWTDMLKKSRDRVELVCCFLAILELCKDNVIRAMQNGEFGEIRLFPAKGAEAQSIAS